MLFCLPQSHSTWKCLIFFHLDMRVHWIKRGKDADSILDSAPNIYVNVKFHYLGSQLNFPKVEIRLSYL